MHKVLGESTKGTRHQPLYNISKFDFQTLLGDQNNIARNLSAYINGLSSKAREIFEKFKFEKEIEQLDKGNLLYLIIKEFASIDLHPEKVDSIQMGYIFEELVSKFNEQAKEEAGDHFTPREVISLMAHLTFTHDEEVYERGKYHSIYDPTCGTGGMLSVSEQYIRQNNPNAHLDLFGKEYNDESYAICCADLLIKDEDISNIIYGDTLGDGKTEYGHKDKKFHYMLANPPFGVEWKNQQEGVEKEHNDLGFSGRFGAGLPRINDGALLFLQHMMSKMHNPPDKDGDGSKIAIVFNGSPLFTGDAGSGESNIRRYIIENDLLDAIVALPDQMFYNTVIFTYIWLVTNRKKEARKGKIQLIDATKHYKKMRKSLGDKRNELGENHIDEITRIYGRNNHNDVSDVTFDGKAKITSKILDNSDFDYLKITVERPLRLNFQFSAERIERLKTESAFINLTKSKKRKDEIKIKEEVASGEKLQAQILEILEKLKSDKLYLSRVAFKELLHSAFEKAKIKLDAPLKKAILNTLSERDEAGEICRDAKGNVEADSELRDTELVPLPKNITLPKLNPKQGEVSDADLSIF